MAKGKLSSPLVPPSAGSKEDSKMHALGGRFAKRVAALPTAVDVRDAYCYDPSEDAQLRHVIDATGASDVYSKVHALEDSFANSVRS